ncbi:MAG: DMT family transporter [Muribaculum sp.]|nr:DMT family transporter [Muribaculum sp.]
MILLLLFALLTGTVTPIQTAANSKMRSVVGPAFAVTMISFVISFAVLLTVSVAFGLPILPTLAQIHATPWWGWTGGIIALSTITIVMYMFKSLGQLQTTILPLLGQLAFSLVIDNFGLFGSIRIPISATRLLALLLVVAGVLMVIVLPKMSNKQTSAATGSHTFLWQIAGVIAGCLMASIGAIYGRLGVILGSPVQASTDSFFIATVVIILVCLLNGSFGKAGRAIREPRPWWMWLGGFCGAAAVFGNAWLIPQIGAGAFFMVLLLGQIILSLCIDGFGWLGATRRKILLIEYVGVAVMIAGVALLRL